MRTFLIFAFFLLVSNLINSQKGFFKITFFETLYSFPLATKEFIPQSGFEVTLE